ncbi:MAG: hypothetical protein RBQ65_05450 [Sphaerochaeta sp.]|nr:hypothetical protein [Sphaerochaeta sp.]
MHGHRPKRHAMIGMAVVMLSIVLPLTPASLILGTGNDWITMGFGNNEDDGHSFSVYGATRFDNGLLLSIDIDGYTDQQTIHKRYSTLNLALSYPFSFQPWPNVELSLSPTVGVHLAGNLGLEAVQNLLHRILGRDEVALPEAYQELKVMALMAASASASVSLGSHRLGVSALASSVPLWESRFDFSLYYQIGKLITIGVGYHLPIAHDDHPVRSIDLAQSHGFYLSSLYQTPLIQTTWIIWPGTGFSWGGFGIDVLSFGQPKRFVHADLSTVSGIYYDTEGFQTRISALLFRGFLLQVHYSNGPTAKGSIYRRNIGMWSLGWQWEPFDEHALLRPSLSLLAGVKRYNLNMNLSQVIIDEIRPAIGIEAGLGLGRKNGWVVGSSAYHFRLGVALHYTFAVSSLTAPDPRWDRIAQPWTLIFGLALQIDHDLDTGVR